MNRAPVAKFVLGRKRFMINFTFIESKRICPSFVGYYKMINIFLFRSLSLKSICWDNTGPPDGWPNRDENISQNHRINRVNKWCLKLKQKEIFVFSTCLCRSHSCIVNERWNMRYLSTDFDVTALTSGALRLPPFHFLQAHRHTRTPLYCCCHTAVACQPKLIYAHSTRVDLALFNIFQKLSKKVNNNSLSVGPDLLPHTRTHKLPHNHTFPLHTHSASAHLHAGSNQLSP